MELQLLCQSPMGHLRMTATLFDAVDHQALTPPTRRLVSTVTRAGCLDSHDRKLIAWKTEPSGIISRCPRIKHRESFAAMSLTVSRNPNRANANFSLNKSTEQT